MKKIIIVLIVLILIAGAGYGGYWYGISKKSSSQLSEIYPKKTLGKPSIPELNSVYQDAITFRTGLNGKGQEEIAMVIDGIQRVAGISFDRSYTGNTLNWYRFDNVSYSDWVSMTDSEKVNSKKIISRLINQNPGKDTGNDSIEYYMDAVVANKIQNFSNNEASHIIKNIDDNLINEQGFTIDDSVFDYIPGLSSHTLIKGNLICHIQFSADIKGNVTGIELQFGFYDEPQKIK